MLKDEAARAAEDCADRPVRAPRKGLSVSQATLSDLDRMIPLLQEVAEVNGEAHRFDEAHGREHLSEKISKGVCFKMEKDGELIGVVTTARVDLGYRYCTSLETSHTYIRKRDRSLKTFRFLLDALKDYAKANGLAIFFHQLAFLQAIRCEETNCEKVADLYTFMKLEEVGGSYMVRPYDKIGYTFLYEPGAEGKASETGDRARRQRLRNVAYAPSGHPSDDDAGNGSA